MTRATVINTGTAKKRRAAKYAADVLAEIELTSLIGVLVFAFHHSRAQHRKNLLRQCAAIFAAGLEDIQRDIRCITQPFERRYLNFLSPEIADSFTINFRFRREHIHCLAKCLRVPTEFKLDNGSWVNGQEGLLVMLRFLAYPTRLVDLEALFGLDLSKLSRINTSMKKLVCNNHQHRVTDYLEWHCK